MYYLKDLVNSAFSEEELQQYRNYLYETFKDCQFGKVLFPDEFKTT